MAILANGEIRRWMARDRGLRACGSLEIGVEGDELGSRVVWRSSTVLPGTDDDFVSSHTSQRSPRKETRTGSRRKTV